MVTSEYLCVPALGPFHLLEIIDDKGRSVRRLPEP